MGQRTEGNEALYVREKGQKREREREGRPDINWDAHTSVRKNKAVVLRWNTCIYAEVGRPSSPLPPLPLLGLAGPLFTLVLVLISLWTDITRQPSKKLTQKNLDNFLLDLLIELAHAWVTHVAQPLGLAGGRRGVWRVRWGWRWRARGGRRWGKISFRRNRAIQSAQLPVKPQPESKYVKQSTAWKKAERFSWCFVLTLFPNRKNPKYPKFSLIKRSEVATP